MELLLLFAVLKICNSNFGTSDFLLYFRLRINLYTFALLQATSKLESNFNPSPLNLPKWLLRSRNMSSILLVFAVYTLCILQPTNKVFREGLFSS